MVLTDIIWSASLVQLVVTSTIMQMVMSSSPDVSENFLLYHITYDY